MAPAKSKAVADGETVLFYDPDQPNGWLSTYSPHPIVLAGVTWPTVEHYFQAQKFCSHRKRVAIRCVEFAADAKALGWHWVKSQRPNWDQIKETVMLKALETKFRQHDELSQKLLGTENRLIIEDSLDDLYWGRGENGRGENRLGCLLMRVRQGLQERTETSPSPA